MNRCQDLFSAISGYEPFDLGSPRDDFYYELLEKKASKEERIEHLKGYYAVYKEDDRDLTVKECELVDELLIKRYNDEFDTENDLYHAWNELEDEE